VVATGITTTIRDFTKKAAGEIGLEIGYHGEGTEEKGQIVSINEDVFVEKVGEKYLPSVKERMKANHDIVAVDPSYFRPAEVDLLIGDATKAKERLNWVPKYDLDGLVKDMMQSDIKVMKKDDYLREGGYRTLNYFE
jgi:GDPmannose 4,6-dehydratase